MKLKTGIFIAIMILFFIPSLKICADGEGYIVKLKDVSIPKELTKLLKEVNSKHRVYFTDDINRVREFGEYIEYTETDDSIYLIDS